METDGLLNATDEMPINASNDHNNREENDLSDVISLKDEIVVDSNIKCGKEEDIPDNDDPAKSAFVHIEEKDENFAEMQPEEDVLAKPLEDAKKLIKGTIENIVPPKTCVDLNLIVGRNHADQSDSDDTKPLVKSGRTRRSRLAKQPEYPANERVCTRSKKQNSNAIEPTSKKGANSKATLNETSKTKHNNSKTKKTIEKKIEKVQEESGEKRCRICLDGKNLINIFKMDESDTIAVKIMIICSSVKITHDDLLPQFICNTCLQSLHVALNFKTLCEATDKDLRSNVKRKKNKIRGQTEFILIDCNEISDSEENLINQSEDDEEFEPPIETDDNEHDSDSGSSYGATKRKSRRTRRKTRKLNDSKSNKSPTTRSRKKNSANDIQNEKSNDEENMTDGEKSSPPKKRRLKNKSMKLSVDGDAIASDSRKKEVQCVYCNEMFPSLNLLREHKKKHAGEKPFTCEICSRTFKLIGSFKAHQEKHKEADSLMCLQCNKHFTNKTELRKHLVDLHGEPVAAFVCEKCKRAFTTERRLDRHKESKCPGFEPTPGNVKKIKPEADAIALGRDLFKCVAPMTTTYWSDSFSD